MTADKLISLDGVAKILGITRNAAINIKRKDERFPIFVKKIGLRTMYSLNEIEAWREKRYSSKEIDNSLSVLFISGMNSKAHSMINHIKSSVVR